MQGESAIICKNIITPEGTFNGCVLIKEGRIISLSDALPPDYAGEITDASEHFLMAGLIDPHVHINEPGRTEWEGFETATKAAASSGITTLIDMPLNSSPVTTNKKNFNLKLRAAGGKINVNTGFWGGVVPGNSGALEDLLNAGVFGLKAFLTHSGIDDFPNSEENDLRNALLILKKYDRPLLVHCELTTGAEHFSEHEKNPSSYQAYLRSRPKEWENNAIKMMIRLCRETQSRVHIVHLSSAEALPMIAAARKEGLPLTVETAQHYLFFHAEDIPDGGTIYKCAPPIREKENNDQLWQALADGVIDFVATDHSPAPPEMKEINSGNLKDAWGGIAGLQFALSSLWTAAKSRGFSAKDISNWLSKNPSDFLRLKNKGRIEAGAGADLFIWDPEKKYSIPENEIHHRHKKSPYANRELYGKVISTYLKGNRIYHNGVLTDSFKGEILKAEKRDI